MKAKIGISSIGLHFPSLALPVEELAKLRQVDSAKYLQGLGCKEIALCAKDEDIVDLAVVAAERALSRWNGDKNDIGLLIVGTESGPDMSRPLSAWVADKLNLKGAIRSYEVKHACYGGTLGVRQATEWKLSDVTPGKVALVIAADISLYKAKNAAEPTQGAGAVAMIIDQPLIAEVEPTSYPFSMPVFDFWHPLDEQYPLVDGEFSLNCYKEAAKQCFEALLQNRSLEEVLDSFKACCFHTPFPKMVKKALDAIAKEHGWSDEKIEQYYQQKVEHTMDWNRLCGNAYTASLWIAVAKTLVGLNEGDKISAFSYGSGCGAELLVLKAGPLAKKGAWAEDVKKDFTNRKEITARDYETQRMQIDKAA